jgi:hypothetical protein
LLGVGIFFLGSLLRTYRWQFLLKRLRIRIPFSRTYSIFMAGLFISNLTPGKIGDPVRSLLLKRVEKKSMGKSLPSIFVERFFDIAAIITISILGFVLLTVRLAELSTYFALAIATWSVLTLGAIYVIMSERRTRWALRKGHEIFSFIPRVRRLGGEIDDFCRNIHSSLVKYKKKSTLIKTYVLSIIIWASDGLILYLAFLALGVQVSLLACLVIIPIAVLIGLLSMLPGGLGSSEIIAAAFFASIFPISLAQVTAAVLLGRAMSYWMSLAVGGFCLSGLK